MFYVLWHMFVFVVNFLVDIGVIDFSEVTAGLSLQPLRLAQVTWSIGPCVLLDCFQGGQGVLLATSDP